MPSKTSKPALTFNQRYIYNYYLYHKRNNKNAPCFVPKSPRSEDKVHYYLKALAKLEQDGYVSVDRSASNYQAWIIKDPITTKELCPTVSTSTKIWR